MPPNLVHIHSLQLHQPENFERLTTPSSSVTMPFTLNFINNQYQYTEPAAEAETDAPTDRRRMSHYQQGTERLAYYKCKWCSAEIKNTYFKYLKHIGACPRMKVSQPANMDDRP